MEDHNGADEGMQEEAGKEEMMGEGTIDPVQRLEEKLDDIIVYRESITREQFMRELDNLDGEIIAIADSSPSPQLFLLLNRVRLEKGDTEGACHGLYRAIGKCGDDPEIRHNLGKVLMDLGDIDQAFDNLNFANRHYVQKEGIPRREVLMDLGACCIMKGMTDTGMDYLLECLRMEEDATVHEMLYRVFTQKGREQSALFHAKRILALIPEGDSERSRWMSRISTLRTNISLENQASGIRYVPNTYGDLKMRLFHDGANNPKLTWTPLSHAESQRLKELARVRGGSFSAPEEALFKRGINDIDDPVSKYFINYIE